METLKKICSGLRNDEITSYQASKMLEAYIRLHSSMPNLSKFNWFKYVSYRFSTNNPLRGVFFENGYKIACNGYTILKLKNSYSKDVEGKIIDKNGAIIDSRYVNYKSVLPIINKEDKEIFIDMGILKTKVRESKMNKKVLQIKDKNKLIIKINNQYYRTIRVELMVNAYDNIENPKIYFKSQDFNDEPKNIFIVGDNGVFFLMAMFKETILESSDYNIVEY